MSFKNKWREIRRNSNYRLAIIGILFAITAIFLYYAKPLWMKIVLSTILGILGIAGGMEIAEKDYDMGKLIETKSFEESKIEKTDDGHWKINDKECQKEAINCDNFDTQEEAQKMFEYCGGTVDDVFSLDRDKDGKACEALPKKKKE